MNVLFEATVGSHFHNTATLNSDVDLRTVYRLSLRERLSPFTESMIKKKEEGTDHEFFELSHFARMLAKCNVTALEIAEAGWKQTGSAIALILANEAMDTEKFTAQCNGFVQGMWNSGTPKSLHHGWRVALLLRRYLLTGDLDFDCTSYPEYDDLMRVKAGIITPHEKLFDKQAPTRIWHIQNLDNIARVVYNTYLQDIKPWREN